MLKTVCPAYLGCQDSIYQTAPLIAAQGGFEGYYSYGIEEDTAYGAEETRRCFAENYLRPTGFRLPVEMNAPPEKFEAAFTKLPGIVALAAEIGYSSALIWIMPGANEMAPHEYHAVLISRLRRLGALLALHRMQLAVELVAPYALQRQYRFPIPATLWHLLDCIEQAELPNIGVVLDLFHFYCAGHTEADYGLLKRREQIIAVHVSDGVPRRLPSEQMDLDRRLPGETGVIDCGPLFRRLCELGYEGPVVPEPCNPSLQGRPFTETLRHAAEALNRVWPA